jgi:diaminohydroxyphosphoribosylaminopyrimidine deaminase/5-amino-6-(5-phosphoribosylamino)uracil reductase
MAMNPISELPPDLLAWADELVGRVRRPGRPGVLLKLAMTLDGKIAVASGDSRWISGETSRQLVHVLRSQLGAVMVGAGTVLADDPLLTVRLPGWPQALRVLVQGRRPWPTLAALADPAPLVIAASGATPPPPTQWPQHQVWTLPDGRGGVDLAALLDRLGADGITGLLLEGGSRLNGAMLAAGLIDHVLVFVAPKLAGEGPTPISGLHLDRMADAIPLEGLEIRAVGSDILLSGAVHRS